MSKAKTKKKSAASDEAAAKTPKTTGTQVTKSKKGKENENKNNNKNNNTVKNKNREIVTSWEMEAVSKFMLELYLDGTITPRKGFQIPKQLIREKFDAYLNLPANKTLKEKFTKDKKSYVFGSVLYRTNFLINTPRGCDYYRIKGSTLYKYFNHLIKTYDSRCLLHGSHFERVDQGGGDGGGKSSGNKVKYMEGQDDPLLYESHDVEENAPCNELVYQGSLIQARVSGFQVTSMGCDVCQSNFATAAEYEKHVEYHADDTDFEFLRKTERLSNQILKLSVQFCKNSHYLCFTLVSRMKKITIDKILLVLARSLFDVHKGRGSYELPDNDTIRFFVDSHLFVQFVEQPILIRLHSTADDSIHYVEEHHYMRIEEIANIPVGLNPCRLPRTKGFKQKEAMPQYLPPDEIRYASASGFGLPALFKISNEFNDYVTNGQTYSVYNICESMKLILQVEDMDIMLKYKSLIQRYATIKTFNNEYSVKTTVTRRTFIENVVSSYDEILVIEEKDQEGSESTLPERDDVDEVRSLKILFGNNEDLRSGKHKSKLYFGMIDRVSTRGRVTFVCDRKIPEDKVYKIIFRPARNTIRYQYRAVELLNTMPMEAKLKFLFPVCDSKPSPKRRHDPLNLINKDISSNPEQYQAVQNILHGPLKNAPYIIFGPPGTGKTTTVTEAILQLYYRKPKARILVTSGSNSACDEVALRLVRVLSKVNDSRAVTRIYSRSNERRVENIEQLLLEYSNMYTSQFYPDVELLHEYRIVVCTLTVVGKLGTGQFGKNGDFFTHVFVDEVAACTEPEVLVGILGMLSKKSSLIISGDHKQLGPTLQSKRAEELGLGVSLMMRLMQRNCYRVDVDGNYDSDVQTRLKRNYRSHPEIVNLYNGMYYNNELMALASSDVRYHCANWHRSPNTEYPIIFHSVFGKTELEPTSPSMYNPIEMNVVLDYVRDLMYFGIGGKKVSQKDIGIISPYKKQYQRIQDELNLRNWHLIETGSVETFQGREKTIIIVSFVRSFTRSLGFLDSPQRLNVALSRPKSLLILIGNPKTLSQNDDLKYIIQQCQLHETMVGAVMLPERTLGNVTNTLDELAVRTCSESTGGSESTVPGEELPEHRQWYQQSRYTPETGNSYGTILLPFYGVIKNELYYDILQECPNIESLNAYPTLNQAMRKNPSKDPLDDLFDNLPRVSNDTTNQMGIPKTPPTNRSAQNRALTICLTSSTTSSLTLSNPLMQNSTTQPYNSLFAKPTPPPKVSQSMEFPTLPPGGNQQPKKTTTTHKLSATATPTSYSLNIQPKPCHSSTNLGSKTTVTTKVDPSKLATDTSLRGSCINSTANPTRSPWTTPSPVNITRSNVGHPPTIQASFFGDTNQRPATSSPWYSDPYSSHSSTDYFHIPIHTEFNGSTTTTRPSEKVKPKSKCIIS